jgi:hypothetical protein
MAILRTRSASPAKIRRCLDIGVEEAWISFFMAVLMASS